MAAALRAAGAHLVLAADSLAMAEDAARLGLIAPEAVAAVGARVEEYAAAPASTRRPRLDTTASAGASSEQIASRGGSGDALDPARHRRPLRGRLGDRPEVHRGLHPAAADGADRRSRWWSASACSGSRCATCRSAPPMRSGPASARSAPRPSASCSSATPRRCARLACIGLIVAGIAGLKLVA